MKSDEIIEELVQKFDALIEACDCERKELNLGPHTLVESSKDVLKRYRAKHVAKVSPAEFLVQWNKYITLPTVRLMSGGRKGKLSARCKDQFFVENWKEGIRRLAASSFCTGNNDRAWKADVDFFLRPDTLAKIIEGKYDDRTPGTKRINHVVDETPLAEAIKQYNKNQEEALF